ncbi:MULTISPECIES: PP2C family serine/threonine-protein phosphatase [unclassified Gordonia (in: high G+C Gram-positive bacteria)]|uniref:PP2C family protein-serine/threonine phosphatase n=1 Tax=unclassified Gordonia (in: high G+C Gram-positive bacteria) TaxID=2657482 RepID=UPI000990E17C|nr:MULTISPECIES: protein phosphatase 2C domain-containing protein [unclassified Gordonia (in: high G+C Gram-positive bacteria)]MCX2752532.1 protein phosphatase 2C domain-containing protein [Gordonia sp. 4N]
MDAATIVRDASVSGTHIVGELRLEWSAACNVGRVRETNEDAALALPGMYLLADGMGGHDSGELASEAALLTLSEATSAGELKATQLQLDDLLLAAQRRIGEIDTETERRAGTTATGIVLVTHEQTPHWLVLNIGDSRTYRFQNGSLNQLTTDHSQVQEFIDAGFLTPEQARTDPRRNVITRALGAGMVDPVADYSSTPAFPGDVLLLCTDGLTGELPDEEIGDILRNAEDSRQAAERLVDAALALGAHDNVTVIVVSVHESVPTLTMPALDDSAQGEAAGAAPAPDPS